MTLRAISKTRRSPKEDGLVFGQSFPNRDNVVRPKEIISNVLQHYQGYGYKENILII